MIRVADKENVPLCSVLLLGGTTGVGNNHCGVGNNHCGASPVIILVVSFCREGDARGRG